MSNAASLSSTAAVQSQDKSYLFYSRADSNGNLAYLTFDGKETDKPYNATFYITIKNEIVSANMTSVQIAAVAYKYQGNHEIRVYFISAAGFLREIGRTNGGDWFYGTLNESDIIASPKSLLAASVDDSEGGKLKLYYNRSDSAKLWCTWVGSDNHWGTRCIQPEKV